MLLNNLDWNLLKALRALLEHQSVTNAAQALGVTQSAMSHNLRRLRDRLDDPILVNSANGMQMTDRAKALKMALTDSLLPLEEALAAHSHFDPQTTTQTIRILLHDYSENVLLPPLSNALQTQAPGICLDLVTGHRTDEQLLAQGDVHLIVGADHPKAGHFRQRKLWKDRLVVVASSHHPRLTRDTITAAEFAAERHVFITKTGVQGGPMDKWLQDQGLRRHKAIVTRHFNSALHHVAATEMVVTLPWRVFDMNRHLPLKALQLPAEPLQDTWSVQLTWAPITHDQPALKWLRETIAKVAKKLPALY